MKTLLLFSLLCCSLFVHAQLRPIDVQHYRFELSLGDLTDQVTGTATIRVAFNKKNDTVSLDLVSIDSAGKGMQVTKVQIDGAPAVWVHKDNRLHILNSRDEGKEKTIAVNYSGVPKDGLIISTNKFGDRTFFADNWPDRARNWLPCVDDPADKASVEFLVTAPHHYQVVSNGVQVEETVLTQTHKLTHWKETVLLPTKIMVIGVAKFAVQYVGDTLGIPLYSWVYPQEKGNAFYDYAQAKDVLPFFINNIGPYPYRKLANVQSTTIFGGMENAGCIFYNETIITGQRQAEDLLAHEIAHQWFGNMATEKSFAHLWLSEGFATYMTDLYIGSKYGEDSMARRLAAERAQVIAFRQRSTLPVVDSATRDFMQLLNANSYQKGGWVLHMLRNHLGHEVFMKGIRAYYKRYTGANASTDDFRQVMEEVSGKDLKAFFKQWLYTPGLPEVQLTHAYDAGKKSLTVTVTQQQGTAFSFPLDLDIQTATGTVRRTVQVSQRQQRFTVEGVGTVKKVVLDPAVRLLFEQK